MRCLLPVHVAACLAACATGVTPPSPDVASTRLAGTVDEFLTRQSGFGWSGNVLLRVHGRVVLAKGYGLADPGIAAPYTTTTAFDVGSFAKTFTAAAILRLEELHRLSVRDTLATRLPGVPPDKSAITIHQLLTHTSGIAVDFPFTDPGTFYEDVSRDEALRRILAAPLEYAPGKGARYSNCGYIVLAAIVEQVSGKPFRTFIRDEIFARAGLHHTTFWGDPALAREPVAVGLDGYGSPVEDVRVLSPTTWCDLGGGEVVSTLADLERWVEALAAGRVVSRASVARLWTPWTPTPLMRGGRYGYGWFLHPTPRGGTLVEHGGDVVAAGCQLSWYRDDDVLFITSTNVRHDLYPTRTAVDRALPSLVFGGDVVWPPRWDPGAAPLDAALGDYRLAGGGRLTVHRRGRRTFIGATGQSAVDLLAQGTDAVRSRRAQLTAAAKEAFDGLVRGDLEPLRRVAGPGNPGFPAAVVHEIEGLLHGPLRSFAVLGTFASGYPHGDPPESETTLVRLGADTAYAIRWGAGISIAATDVPRVQLAADTELRADGPRSLVAWDLVHKLVVPIEVSRDGNQLTIGGIVATRIGPTSRTSTRSPH
ncbi:MAG TPA: serine hydrolase domain-containing protein [Kofleriaceae bacterium]|nr:serine hydrolase domain-containing protein [Kofleriaceae bacterium]